MQHVQQGTHKRGKSGTKFFEFVQDRCQLAQVQNSKNNSEWGGNGERRIAWLWRPRFSSLPLRPADRTRCRQHLSRQPPSFRPPLWRSPAGRLSSSAVLAANHTPRRIKHLQRLRSQGGRWKRRSGVLPLAPVLPFAHCCCHSWTPVCLRLRAELTACVHGEQSR